VTLKSTQKISAFEYIMEIKDNLSEFPEVETNSTFLTKNGRKIKNLQYVISNNEVRFGAYSTGDEDGVFGEYTIGIFSTELNISKIKLYKGQCVDSLASVVDCTIEINKDEEK